MRLPIAFALLAAAPAAAAPPDAAFLEANCTSCHDADRKAGRLDLTALTFDPADAKNFAAWVAVFDRVRAGEMPPKNKLEPTERDGFTAALEKSLAEAEADRVAKDGRSTRRRLNRHEYENALRDLLGAPWLPVRDALPEDAVAHGFNKVGDALDVSHVQVARYLAAADDALREVVAAQVEKPESRTVRYHARDQERFTRRMFFSAFNQAPERATFPVLGTAAQPDVRAGKAPMTVGPADPKARELEGVGLVSGAYEPVLCKFNQFKAPMSGRYKLRFNALSVWVGPNGSQTNKPPHWSIPNLDDVSKGRRPEPVVVFAEAPPNLLRRLGAFDVTPEGGVHELDVYLHAGETIRPDAARLFRSRPGATRWVNPLAEKDGQPGVVYRWMEAEGPVVEHWPTAGRALLFGDLPLKAAGDRVEVVSAEPAKDAERLLANFARRAYRRPVSDAEAVRFLPVVEGRLKAGNSFADAMLAGYTAVLCSPEFLTLHESPGKLDDHAVAARLAFFLWNSEPDAELRALAAKGTLRDPAVLRAQAERLLGDPKARRFTDAFLDYWLDLRRMGANNPDADLYNDYYLDDLLTDSALDETRLFFAELLKDDLPARNLVASDFAMLNERLALHYGLPKVDGVALRKVALPARSVRGGLLTQASVLSVTANGTTTSPVLRGAWINERILGRPSPPPPPVPAVEPDLRGTTTIREQLAKHRDQASCAACHSKIDPPGFALESFDVMGGYRERYRALGEPPQRVPGYGKNGHPFAFRHGPPVDCTGDLPGGGKFADVREFKALLLADERQLARNLARQLSVYATGAPVGFRDRAAIESILDAAKPTGYGVRSLVHALVQSELFLTK
jgi:hypothetical protein